MDFGLSDDHRLLRDTVREFARAEVALVAEGLDATKSFPYEIVSRLGELDLMGIPFPERYGGAGGDALAYALVVEELARVGERHPGYEAGTPYRKMGWNASDTRPLSFQDCHVPAENLVGPRGEGLRQFLRVLDIGRIGVAAMGVGLAQGALDQALEYASQRRAFGRPASRFQTIQAKLADMSAEIEATRLMVHKAAWLKETGADFTLTAAQAKLTSGRLAVRAADEAVQIHDGYGYIEGIRSAASTATPRSSPSARAPMRSSRW